jgi:hypothetical protein
VVFSTNKTDHHGITEILLKVALNTIKHSSLLDTLYFKVTLFSAFFPHEKKLAYDSSRLYTMYFILKNYVPALRNIILT